MVINDHRAILDWFKNPLSDEGYRVTLDRLACQTGEPPQTVMELHRDLVILDPISAGEHSW